MTETVQSFILQPKRVPLSQDYRLSNNVLGLGINGKVIECYSKADGRKYALKVSKLYLLTLLVTFSSSSVIVFELFLYMYYV